MVLQVILLKKLDYIGCNIGFAEFLGQQAHLISISGGNGATQINAPIYNREELINATQAASEVLPWTRIYRWFEGMPTRVLTVIRRGGCSTCW